MNEKQKGFMKARLKLAISRRAAALARGDMINVIGYNEIISRTIRGLSLNLFM